MSNECDYLIGSRYELRVIRSTGRIVDKLGAIHEIEPQAVRVLFSLLDAEGGPVHSLDLAEEHWPGTPTERSNLYSVMAKLKRGLRSAVPGTSTDDWIVKVKDRGYSFVAPFDVAHDPGNLMRCSEPIVGREADTNAVVKLVAKSRLVTLVGHVGVGKTRLAVHIGNLLRGSYTRDGVWLVDCFDIDDPIRMLQGIARALDLAFDPRKEIWATLTRRLGNSKLLLILDGCDTLGREAATFVQRLLALAPRMSLLATSARPLRAAGEHVYALNPLLTPNRLSSRTRNDLKDCGAIQCFAAYAKRRDHRFELSSNSLNTVSRIANRLEGLPLALELAAGLVGTKGLDELYAELKGSKAYKVLIGGDGSKPDRHQTLEALFSRRYHALTSAERIAFERLSVFRGGWTFESAIAIVGHDFVEGQSVKAMLDGFVDGSLVSLESRPSGSRYRYLELLRDFASDCLEKRGELFQIRLRHLTWMAKLVARVPPADTGQERDRFLDRIDVERPNLEAALRFAIDTGADVETGARVLVDLTGYWMRRKTHRKAVRWLDSILKKRDELSEALLGVVLRSRAWFSVYTPKHQEDVVAGLTMYLESIELLRSLGQLEDLAVAIQDVVVCLAGQNLGRALILADEGVEICERLGDAAGAVAISYNRALIHLDYGTGAAEEAFTSCINALRRSESTNRRLLAACHLSLGDLAVFRGDVETGRQQFRRVRKLVNEERDLWLTSKDLEIAEARLAVSEGKLASASRKLRLVLDSDDKERDQELLLDAIDEVACLYSALGSSKEGKELVAIATAVRGSTGYPRSPFYSRMLCDRINLDVTSLEFAECLKLSAKQGLTNIDDLLDLAQEYLQEVR